MLDFILGSILVIGCIPFILNVSCLLKNFVCRQDKFYQIQRKMGIMTRIIWLEGASTGTTADKVFLVLFSVCDWLISLIVYCILLVMVREFGEPDVLLGLVVFFAVCVIPFVLRFIVDMTKGTGLNKNTGDLETIQSLQKEVQELKELVNNKK